MATVLLVRHGRTAANAGGVLAGWTPGVVLDDTGEVLDPPAVSARGVPAVDNDDSALRGIRRDVLAALARVRGWRGVDLEDEVRRAARRSVTHLSGARPVVEVLLSRRSRP